jgi:hypothetical protein
MNYLRVKNKLNNSPFAFILSYIRFYFFGKNIIIYFPHVIMNDTAPLFSTIYYYNNNAILIAQRVLSFLPLLLIFIGVSGNLVSLFIFRLNSSLKKMPSIIFLSFVVILNTISLFIWNLDDFLAPNFGFRVEKLVTCRLLGFIQYMTLQASGFILSLTSIDRYVTVISMPGSIASRLPFSTIKSSLNWSILCVSLAVLINFHLLVFNGYYDEPIMYKITIIERINDTLSINRTEQLLEMSQNFNCDSYSPHFKIKPLWEYVHLVLFCLVPFTTMFTFNCLLIRKLINRSKSDKYSKKNNKLTKVLLFISFVYIILSLPNANFFSIVVFILKNAQLKSLFLNQSIIFFIFFFTYEKFRKIFKSYLWNFNCIRCKKDERCIKCDANNSPS